MYISRRRRYADPLRQRGRIRSSVLVLLCLILVVVAASRVATWFRPRPAQDHPPMVLSISDRGVVQVKLRESEELQRANDALKLYTGDSVFTGPAAEAVLTSFDTSTFTLGENTTVALVDVRQWEGNGVMHVELKEGQVAVRTGTASTVERLLSTPEMDHHLTPSLIGVFSTTDTYIFESTGLGVETVSRKGAPFSVIIGEGQEYHLTPESLRSLEAGEATPYDFRSRLSKNVRDLPLLESRLVTPPPQEEQTLEQDAPQVDLVLTEPREGITLTGATVRVSGTVSERVAVIRINGYGAPLDRGAFSREVTLPEEETSMITIEAEDGQGLVVATATRTVSRDLHPPEPPAIRSPGSGGSIVTTAEVEVVIAGTAPSEAAAIIVNGYRLQKFSSGDPEWSYIASSELGNLLLGENRFSIVALDRHGNSSPAAEITIVRFLTPPPTGPSSPDRSLRVTSPKPSSPYATDRQEVLLEGEAPPGTMTITVNGYALRKFVPGTNHWSYIASRELGTLHRGRNTYVILAMDANRSLLDSLTYVINVRLTRGQVERSTPGGQEAEER